MEGKQSSPQFKNLMHLLFRFSFLKLFRLRFLLLHLLALTCQRRYDSEMVSSLVLHQPRHRSIPHKYSSKDLSQPTSFNKANNRICHRLL